MIVDHEALNSLANINAFANIIGITNPGPKVVMASRYLVKVSDDSDVAAIRDKLLVHDYVISIKTIKGEIEKSKEIKQMDFGIPGLLTADFIISLLTATLATFIFMSILMEKRKKEFAVLRSYGASDRQIYKIVFSETTVLLLTAVLWGLLIGLGLSVLFNPFFELINVFLTPMTGGGSSLSRLIVFDLWSLGFTLFVTFFAMMLATFLSVRSASRAKISTVVREL
ncbi:MAG: FtsX-like permease family protein [Candidatus Hodarchaeales archaeon]